MRPAELALLLLPAVADAHFRLMWPAARGFDENKAGAFPCGGFDTPSSDRTDFPMSGAPIQLSLEHTESRIQVLLALGDGDGAFSIELANTFQETGPEDFCLGAGRVMIPEGVNITEGDRGTIQVVTNGDPEGGLYQCADVTFVSATLSPEDYDTNCKNSTGVSAEDIDDAGVFANGTTVGDDHGDGDHDDHGEEDHDHSTMTGDAAAEATSTDGVGPAATVGAWLAGAMGVAAGMAAL